MTAELFSPEASPSPKSLWLAKHRLRTRKEDLPRWNSGPRSTEPWVCENAGGTYRATGNTEEEATRAYANERQVTHWTVEQWRADIEAMARKGGEDLEEL